ncbi:MAG TPA: penicillin-binding transpeptidase domain-containing protein, partial [Micromonosporaceae bacterium]|nr:penicillin-binding transpeptidase domain-containing protein [Micromonosporaceae bacterium]
MVAASGCTSDGVQSAPMPTAGPTDIVTTEPAPPAVTVRDDLAEVFTQAGTTGTFVLYDVHANRLIMVDQARAETPMVPASTFKIAHSLIALETGVVKDVTEKIPYGGQPQP